jgi:hypothetical protein
MKNSSYLSTCEDGTQCSEALAYKIQTPGNYPEESIQRFRFLPSRFQMSTQNQDVMNEIYYACIFFNVACLNDPTL